MDMQGNESLQSLRNWRQVRLALGELHMAYLLAEHKEA